MEMLLEPHIGTNTLKFGADRVHIRDMLSENNLTSLDLEPENDMYPDIGLILGYDNDDKLEFIEILPPSTAQFEDIEFFSNSLSNSIEQMHRKGYSVEIDEGGYNFEAVGIGFYSPGKELKSVSLYKKGYYDDL